MSESHYAVIMQYPGDGVLVENGVEFFSALDRAVAYRDSVGDDSCKVFRVEPVSESSLWDWATRKEGSDGDPMIYTGERAARTCCPEGYELLKRRRGADAWSAVTR